MSPKPKKRHRFLETLRKDLAVLETFQVRIERTVRQSVMLTFKARSAKAALNRAERDFREGEILHWGAPEPVSMECQIVEPPTKPDAP